VSVNENAQTHSRESGHLQVQLIRQADFFAAFTPAFLRTLADIVRFLFIVTTFAFPPFAFTLTHRALWQPRFLLFQPLKSRPEVLSL